MTEIFNNILLEIQNVLEGVSDKDFVYLVNEISKSKRIFLCASGRSELMLEAFAMRLAQMDLNVYVIGESDTPKVRKGNLLICVSGSGSTKATLHIVKDSKKLGAKIITISSKKVSPIGKLSKKVIEIKKDFKPFTFYTSKTKARYLLETPFEINYKIGDKFI